MNADDERDYAEEEYNRELRDNPDPEPLADHGAAAIISRMSEQLQMPAPRAQANYLLQNITAPSAYAPESRVLAADVHPTVIALAQVYATLAVADQLTEVQHQLKLLPGAMP